MGWATGCSGTRSYQKEAIDVMDNIEVEEHATVGYRVSIHMDVVGLVKKSLVEAGLLPAIGQDNEEHLKNAIAMEPFTVQVEDNQTGKVQYEYQRCEIATESWNLNARSLMMTGVDMVGIRAVDSAET